MYNEREIENPRLQKTMDQVRQVLERNGFAGAFMVISPDEAAFAYVMAAPWSAFTSDSATPMGFRIRASEKADGVMGRHEKLEGAAHTILQLRDFGAQTFAWMEDFRTMLERTGLAIEHVPFGGRPPGTIAEGQVRPPPGQKPS